MTILDGPRVAPLSGDEAKHLVILLHGYGSDGADLISFAPIWQPLLPDAAFVAPNGPMRCPGAGYQWWPLDTFGMEALAAGAQSAAPLVNAFIDQELARTGLTDDDLLLVGFSQGTMMCLQVGPRRPRPAAGIIGYSGMLVSPEKLGPELQSRPPILLVHGEDDPMVPVRAMTDARSLLQGLEFDVESHVSPHLGHGVDQDGLDRGGQFARRMLLNPRN